MFSDSRRSPSHARRAPRRRRGPTPCSTCSVTILAPGTPRRSGCRPSDPPRSCCMRHLADRFERSPEGVELPVADTAAALGLGARDGNSSPLIRSLTRLRQFELACTEDEQTISVRRSLPPVHRRHVRRLPAPLQAEHEEWVAGQTRRPARARAPPGAPRRAHARRAGRDPRHRRTRAAHRRLPPRPRARSGALGPRPPTRARHRHRPARAAVTPRGGVGPLPVPVPTGSGTPGWGASRAPHPGAARVRAVHREELAAAAGATQRRRGSSAGRGPGLRRPRCRHPTATRALAHARRPVETLRSSHPPRAERDT